MIIKASGSVTGTADVTMANSVSRADIYITNLTGGSALIQIADPSSGTYVTDQTNGTVTADGRYVVEMVMPAQIRVLGAAATGAANVYMVGK